MDSGDKLSNKTKEEIAEGGPLRVTSAACAIELVPKVETVRQIQGQSVTLGW